MRFSNDTFLWHPVPTVRRTNDKIMQINKMSYCYAVHTIEIPLFEEKKAPKSTPFNTLKLIEYFFSKFIKSR